MKGFPASDSVVLICCALLLLQSAKPEGDTVPVVNSTQARFSLWGRLILGNLNLKADLPGISISQACHRVLHTLGNTEPG